MRSATSKIRLSWVTSKIVQEMMHGKDILPLENERLVNTLTDLITSNQS
jgi:hypothetical protein